MDDNHVCQYGKCEDPPKWKLLIFTILASTKKYLDGQPQDTELLVCDHHFELMKKSVSIRITSVTKV